jgi:hypothetical protein
MKYFKNDVASFNYNETVLPSVINLCNLIKVYPFILKPFRGKDEKVEAILSSSGFILYPTVKKTTLFYESTTDCFFKIFHPLTLKHKIFFLFKNRIRAIYNLSEYLLSKGIRVPEITAYGLLKSSRLFFVMRRIEGKSLYDILIGEKMTIPKEMYLKIVDKVAEVHSLGHWLGDAHLSHIFVNNSGVSGFIDIDSIKKNRPFRLRNLAKDLAGFNHPGLPIAENEKMDLLKYYMKKLEVRDREKFLRLVTHYTERRWKV